MILFSDYLKKRGFTKASDVRPYFGKEGLMIGYKNRDFEFEAFSFNDILAVGEVKDYKDDDIQGTISRIDLHHVRFDFMGSHIVSSISSSTEVKTFIDLLWDLNAEF